MPERWHGGSLAGASETSMNNHEVLSQDGVFVDVHEVVFY